MKTSILITAFSLLFVLSIMFADADARCLEDPCYYYQPPRVIDSSGNTLGFVMVGQQVQITIDVANAEDYEQPFVALIQVVDENNSPISLNWISGVLNPGHSFSPATSWIPKKSGYYEATVYLWDSLERKIPLSPTVATSIDVLSKNDLRKTRGDFMECKDNLELIQKYDGSAACVKLTSVIDLIKRNWTTTEVLMNMPLTQLGKECGHYTHNEFLNRIQNHTLDASCHDFIITKALESENEMLEQGYVFDVKKQVWKKDGFPDTMMSIPYHYMISLELENEN